MVSKSDVKYTDRINSKKSGQDIKFNNKFITENINIRDCMSHTSGLNDSPVSILGLYGYDTNTIERSFRYYQNEGFRTLFHYNNNIFSLGFETACKIVNETIESQFRDFFNKFNMNDTTTNLRAIQASKKRVTSYLVEDGTSTPTQPFNQTTFIPAGGVASTLTDMMKFLKIHLKQQIKGLDRIYSKVVISGPPNGEYYGIGTAIEYPLLNPVYFYPGLYGTGVAHIVLYDIKTQIGIVILTNSVNPVPDPLVFYIYLQLLGYTDLANKVYDERLALAEEEIAGVFSCETVRTYFKNPPIECSKSDKNCDCNKCRHDDIMAKINVCSSEPMVFHNDKYGKLVIENGMITVGKLKPVKFTIKDNSIYFTVQNINNQPLSGIGQFAIGVHDDLVLNTLIECTYAMYEQRQ